MRSNISYSTHMQRRLIFAHVPNMKYISITGLFSFIPFISGQDESKRRHGRRFYLDQPSLNSCVSMIIRQNIVTSVIIIETRPFRLFVNAHGFEPFTLVIKC